MHYVEKKMSLANAVSLSEISARNRFSKIHRNPYFYLPQTNLWEGNIFTRVCLFTGSVAGGMHGLGVCITGEVCVCGHA